MPVKGSKVSKVPEYTFAEVVLAVTLAAGCSAKEAGEVLGISEKWTYVQREALAATVESLALKLKPLIKFNKREIKQMSKEEAENQLERLLGHSIAVLMDALESGDLALAYQASKEIRDRALGKPNQNVNVSSRGRVDHHVYVTTPEALAALSVFDRDVVTDSDMHAKARELRGASVTGAIDVDHSSVS